MTSMLTSTYPFFWMLPTLRDAGPVCFTLLCIFLSYGDITILQLVRIFFFDILRRNTTRHQQREIVVPPLWSRRNQNHNLLWQQGSRVCNNSSRQWRYHNNTVYDSTSYYTVQGVGLCGGGRRVHHPSNVWRRQIACGIRYSVFGRDNDSWGSGGFVYCAGGMLH